MPSQISKTILEVATNYLSAHYLELTPDEFLAVVRLLEWLRSRDYGKMTITKNKDKEGGFIDWTVEDKTRQWTKNAE